MNEEVIMSRIAEMKQPPFAEFLGIKITHISPERVTGELVVRSEIATMPDIIHGGAVMALADNIGAVATVANLPEGAHTTTIESKTNFFAPIPVGNTARAECTPLHRGRTTMVWQTRITRDDGRLCALVTQTQLVLQPGKK
jgi:1,4-dihydroxy-2-naphthoyl-CoA hydrolase